MHIFIIIKRALLKVSTSRCKCDEFNKILMSKHAIFKESLGKYFYLQFQKAITILNFFETKVDFSSKDKCKK